MVTKVATFSNLVDGGSENVGATKKETATRGDKQRQQGPNKSTLHSSLYSGSSPFLKLLHIP